MLRKGVRRFLVTAPILLVKIRPAALIASYANSVKVNVYLGGKRARRARMQNLQRTSLNSHKVDEFPATDISLFIYLTDLSVSASVSPLLFLSLSLVAECKTCKERVLILTRSTSSQPQNLSFYQSHGPLCLSVCLSVYLPPPPSVCVCVCVFNFPVAHCEFS